MAENKVSRVLVERNLAAIEERVIEASYLAVVLQLAGRGLEEIEKDDWKPEYGLAVTRAAKMIDERLGLVVSDLYDVIKP